VEDGTGDEMGRESLGSDGKPSAVKAANPPSITQPNERGPAMRHAAPQSRSLLPNAVAWCCCCCCCCCCLGWVGVRGYRVIGDSLALRNPGSQLASHGFKGSKFSFPIGRRTPDRESLSCPGLAWHLHPEREARRKESLATYPYTTTCDVPALFVVG
jgi:hypothetical protein